MKHVTLHQFERWVKKNEKHTWFLGSKKPVSFDVKYFYLAFDTRTQTIFRVAASKGGDSEASSHVGDGDNSLSILDALEEKLGWKGGRYVRAKKE